MEKIKNLIDEIEWFGGFKNEPLFLRKLRNLCAEVSGVRDFRGIEGYRGAIGYYHVLQRHLLSLLAEEAKQADKASNPYSKNWKPFYVEDSGIGKMVLNL